jgi:hypothetical protein
LRSSLGSLLPRSPSFNWFACSAIERAVRGRPNEVDRIECSLLRCICRLMANRPRSGAPFQVHPHMLRHRPDTSSPTMGTIHGRWRTISGIASAKHGSIRGLGTGSVQGVLERLTERPTAGTTLWPLRTTATSMDRKHGDEVRSRGRRAAYFFFWLRSLNGVVKSDSRSANS